MGVTGLVLNSHPGAKPHFIPVAQGRRDDLKRFQPFAEKPYPRIYFSQALLSVNVVTIFRAVAVCRCGTYCLGDVRAFDFPQRMKLRPQCRLTLWRNVRRALLPRWSVSTHWSSVDGLVMTGNTRLESL